MHTISEGATPPDVSAARVAAISSNNSNLTPDQVEVRTQVLKIADNINDCLDEAFCSDGSSFQAPNMYWAAAVLSQFVRDANECVKIDSLEDTKVCFDGLSEQAGVAPAQTFSNCVLT